MNSRRENDPWRLERFVAAQDRAGTYRHAVAELRAGAKMSHWMWFVFPQIAGLGMSATSRQYAISSVQEARAYLAHPVLGPRLRECAQIVADTEVRSAERIFGPIDAIKLRSSMTLFAAADEAGETAVSGANVFHAVLVRYFGGVPDEATVARLLRIVPRSTLSAAVHKGRSPAPCWCGPRGRRSPSRAPSRPPGRRRPPRARPGQPAGRSAPGHHGKRGLLHDHVRDVPRRPGDRHQVDPRVRPVDRASRLQRDAPPGRTARRRAAPGAPAASSANRNGRPRQAQRQPPRWRKTATADREHPPDQATQDRPGPPAEQQPLSLSVQAR
jgi:uncharacterized protein (DUF1810 family)